MFNIDFSPMLLECSACINIAPNNCWIVCQTLPYVELLLQRNILLCCGSMTMLSQVQYTIHFTNTARNFTKNFIFSITKLDDVSRIILLLVFLTSFCWQHTVSVDFYVRIKASEQYANRRGMEEKSVFPTVGAVVSSCILKFRRTGWPVYRLLRKSIPP